MEAELIGHRGYREWDPQLPAAQQTPENSIEAFTKSFSPKGLDGVELDVHLSKDNKLVVFHDDDLNELTNVNELLQPHDPATGPDPLLNVNGVDLTRLRALRANDPNNETNDPQNGKIYIADLDLNEIQALRLKTHLDPDGVRHTAEQHAIPTLTQVFQAVDAARAADPDRRFKITIEVKEASMVERRETDWTFVTENEQPRMINKDIAGAVTGTISDFLQGQKQAPWSKTDNLVVSSFHKMTLGRLRAADPDIPRSALYSKFEQRDFRVSGGNLEMKNRGAQDWTPLRAALTTDRLFNADERVWDMTEAELTQAFADDAKLPIVDFAGKQLTDGAGQPLVGVRPQNISISISEMTPEVVDRIRGAGAEVAVWTANEQLIDRRPPQQRSDLFDFLQTHGVTSFITDNSNKMVLERDAWRERRQAAQLSQQQAATQATGPAPALATITDPSPSVPIQATEPAPVLAAITDPSPSVPTQPTEPAPAPAATTDPSSSVAPPPARQRRSSSPRPAPAPQQQDVPDIEVASVTTTTSRPRSTGAGVQPQRRRRNNIPLIPEDLPAGARPFNNDGSTPGRVRFDAAFANGLSQTVAMCVAYGVALSYMGLLASKVLPNEDGTITRRLGRAVGQALLQAPMLAIAEESVFGLAAEAGAAALGGAVAPRSDPYPEFKLPVLPENPTAAAITAHNTALEYVGTHGGSTPDEAPNHPFSGLALYPDNSAATDFQAQLDRYNDPQQVELRRRAEGIFRDRPLELSDYPEPNADAPAHIRDGLPWQLRKHEAEVGYANDLLREAGIAPIPDRTQNPVSYDQDVREVRGLLEDRSRGLTVARLTFAQDQRSADYGSFPIDSVLIGAFAFCAGASAASLPKSLLQSVWGTTLAGTVFGAVNNLTRLQNRHFPDRLPGAPGEPQEAGAALPANNDTEMGTVPARQRTYPNGIPTHYVVEGRGLQHGMAALGEIWNAISSSERLSEGVLGARNPLEKVRNQSQQLASYLIGSSYGLTAYTLVRTAIDHAVGGSQGRWQSFVRETAATAAFVACGDLSILHHSVAGRRGVTDVSPAYAATKEALGDLWKRASGQDVFSTVDRNRASRVVNWGYDTVEKAFRVTQHALMDTVDLAARTLVRADGAGRRAETEEYFGRNAPPPTAYGTLPFQGAEVDRAGRASAIRSLSGDKPLSQDEAVKRLADLQNQAEKFWPAQNRLEKLWGEILTASPAVQQAAQEATPVQQPPTQGTSQVQQPPAQGVTQVQQPPAQGVTQVQPPGGDDQPLVDGVLAGWQPTKEQIKECDEVLQDLKAAREAIDILRKAEINVARARSEQATEQALTSIVDNLAAQRPVASGITELMQQPESGIDHKTFEAMLDRAITDVNRKANEQNVQVAQLDRQNLLTQGYTGINERTVSMVSEVMADLVKNDKQQSRDVAAVMETLVDDARRTGMTENRFNQIVRDQFHNVAQGANAEEANRLNTARPAIAQRITGRYTELASNAIDNRQRDLEGKEKVLTRQVQAHKSAGRR